MWWVTAGVFSIYIFAMLAAPKKDDKDKINLFLKGRFIYKVGCLHSSCLAAYIFALSQLFDFCSYQRGNKVIVDWQ